jgi:hypothetical protein
LKDHVPHTFIMPWRSGTLDHVVEQRDAWMKKDARQYGRALSLDDGCQMYGPVSRAKGELEIHCLSVLYRSIAVRGYRRDVSRDGDVRGEFLTEAGGNSCFLIRSGQHRIAVVAALGLPSIPMRIIDPPVKREEVEYWPQVIAGTITPEGALAVFDRVIEGWLAPSLQLSPPRPQRPKSLESMLASLRGDNWGPLTASGGTTRMYGARAGRQGGVRCGLE